MQSTIERRLRLVQPRSATPATPCPVWCAVTNHEDGDRFHYGDATEAGPVSLRLEIAQDGRPFVEIRTECADGDELALREIDDLIGALQAKRRELAALTRTDWGDAS